MGDSVTQHQALNGACFRVVIYVIHYTCLDTHVSGHTFAMVMFFGRVMACSPVKNSLLATLNRKKTVRGGPYLDLLR